MVKRFVLPSPLHGDGPCDTVSCTTVYECRLAVGCVIANAFVVTAEYSSNVVNEVFRVTSAEVDLDCSSLCL